MNYFIIIFLVLFCVCYFKLRGNKNKSEKFTNQETAEISYSKGPIIPIKNQYVAVTVSKKQKKN